MNTKEATVVDWMYDYNCDGQKFDARSEKIIILFRFAKKTKHGPNTVECK